MFEKITTKFSDIMRTIGGKASITEKNIDDAVEAIKIALLEADVNLRVVRRFINATVDEAKGEKVLRAVNPGQQFVKIVHDKLVAFLGDTNQALALKGPDTLSTLLMLGLQGSGKTTSSGKLALKLKKEGRRPLLVAADLVRPAAVEQLAVLAQQIDVPIYREEGAKDPVKLVKNALLYAKKNPVDTLIVDTTGRLQLDAPMMQELERIRDVCKPQELLLVADAMTGQSAVDIAKEFNEKIGLTGVILTKFDSDTRGGAALSLKTVTGTALKFVGVGEKMEDLEAFHPERMAGRILGMGDVVSFVEKAQEVVDQEEAMQLQAKMEKENFTLQDWLEQIQNIRKMGNLKSMMDMIPGMAGQISEDDVDMRELAVQEAIICSMTKRERANHILIGPTRRKRIALGSGTSVGEVARLLKKFEKTRGMMKKMAKLSKNPAQAQAMLSRLGGM